MRRILVENARRKRAARGTAAATGGSTSPRSSPPSRTRAIDLLALDEALGARSRPRTRATAELVKLRFFAGLTIDQAAEVLGISAATADDDWAYARAWLRVADAR